MTTQLDEAIVSIVQTTPAILCTSDVIRLLKHDFDIIRSRSCVLKHLHKLADEGKFNRLRYIYGGHDCDLYWLYDLSNKHRFY